MLFNSIEFIIFFAIILVLYFACPQRFRWGLLLAASYYFYACWKLEYLILIAASTVIDYWAGLRMGRLSDKAKRKKYLLFSLFCNLGILFAFKYFNFFNDSLRAAFGIFNIPHRIPMFKVLLPVGISFYTFQTIGYSIDVYRGKRPPEKHLGIFALYVSFFPQLVAGPIERSMRLLPQFRKTHDFDWSEVKDGLTLMLWGFFKKLVIADRLAVYVDRLYSDPNSFSGLKIIPIAYLFVYQIYCDFSGYSDIAIGSAQVMGYKLMTNFDRPFAARSIRELWRRWHISLTKWVMDYLYMPMARNRSKGWPRQAALFIVFVLIGLWHGANWTFVVFGGLNGSFIIFSEVTKAFRNRFTLFTSAQNGSTTANSIALKFHKYWQIVFTLSLFSFAGIFFRADSISDALAVIGNIFQSDSSHLTLFIRSRQDIYELTIIGFAILSMEVIQWQHSRSSVLRAVERKPLWFRWAVYYSLIFSVLMLGQFDSVPFIYFQF